MPAAQTDVQHGSLASVKACRSGRAGESLAGAPQSGSLALEPRLAVGGAVSQCPGTEIGQGPPPLPQGAELTYLCMGEGFCGPRHSFVAAARHTHSPVGPDGAPQPHCPLSSHLSDTL